VAPKIDVIATLKARTRGGRPGSKASATPPTMAQPVGPTSTLQAIRTMLTKEKAIREPTSGSRSRTPKMPRPVSVMRATRSVGGPANFQLTSKVATATVMTAPMYMFAAIGLRRLPAAARGVIPPR
jgi:hypothetical protein